MSDPRDDERPAAPMRMMDLELDVRAPALQIERERPATPPPSEIAGEPVARPLPAVRFTPPVNVLYSPLWFALLMAAGVALLLLGTWVLRFVTNTFFLPNPDAYKISGLVPAGLAALFAGGTAIATALQYRRSSGESGLVAMPWRLFLVVAGGELALLVVLAAIAG